jgi:hypothetical protein
MTQSSQQNNMLTSKFCRPNESKQSTAPTASELTKIQGNALTTWTINNDRQITQEAQQDESLMNVKFQEQATQTTTDVARNHILAIGVKRSELAKSHTAPLCVNIRPHTLLSPAFNFGSLNLLVTFCNSLRSGFGDTVAFSCSE